MPTRTSHTYHDRRKDPPFLLIVPKIWTSQRVHMFSKLRLSQIVTRSAWSIGHYITAIVRRFQSSYLRDMVYITRQRYHR